MVDSRISDFSRRFSAALQGVMRENKVRVDDVARASGRSKGFVSQHTSGKAAPDTDLLDAVAQLIGMDTRELVREIVRRMPGVGVDYVWGSSVELESAGESAVAPPNLTHLTPGENTALRRHEDPYGIQQHAAFGEDA